MEFPLILKKEGGQAEFPKVYHLAKICWKLCHKVITQQAQVKTGKIQIWNILKKYMNKLVWVIFHMLRCKLFFGFVLVYNKKEQEWADLCQAQQTSGCG